MGEYELLWWAGLGLLAIGMLAFDLGPYLFKRFKKHTKDEIAEYREED